MVEIMFRKWEELDIKALAEISAKVRKAEGLGVYTPNRVEEYIRTMNERYPMEVVVLAIENGQIVGWMSIERATDNIGEVGRWQPFVISDRDRRKIAQLLIANIIDYATSNDMTRVEIGFGGISEDNLGTFNTRCSWYEAEGWKKLEDSNFMAGNPIEAAISETRLPDDFELQPLLDSDNDAIFECYHEAFTTGDARWIYDMSKAQRKQEFEKSFDRSCPINKDASFAILSDGAIVGFILVVSRSDDEEHLESIGVHPMFRRKGLGKTLLGKSTEVLRGQKVQSFTLGVDPVNIPAVRLYEKFGFKTVSRTTRYSWKTSDP
ncbi:MAG: GNAT family N-acetyltransferase [Candidatus Thorarchaeota archaeon]